MQHSMDGEFLNQCTAQLWAVLAILDVIQTVNQIATKPNHSAIAFHCSRTLSF